MGGPLRALLVSGSMATSVMITGSGIPLPSPGRAGAGALVRHDGTLIQVDAGPATLFRLTEAGVDITRAGRAWSSPTITATT